jgi:hypothetical protein
MIVFAFAITVYFSKQIKQHERICLQISGSCTCGPEAVWHRVIVSDRGIYRVTSMGPPEYVQNFWDLSLSLSRLIGKNSNTGQVAGGSPSVYNSRRGRSARKRFREGATPYTCRLNQ